MSSIAFTIAGVPINPFDITLEEEEAFEDLFGFSPNELTETKAAELAGEGAKRSTQRRKLYECLAFLIQRQIARHRKGNKTVSDIEGIVAALTYEHWQQWEETVWKRYAEQAATRERVFAATARVSDFAEAGDEKNE